MKVFRRTQFGDPVLRAKAKPVSLRMLRTPTFRTLVKRMIYTMRRAQGIGLAAPQIGKSLQLVVMELRPTKTRPNLKRRGPIVVVNPKLVSRSKTKRQLWEGCLSLDGVRAKAARSSSVVVTYLNADGRRVQEKATGLWAQLFQHEIDHLNGVLYTDRIEDKASVITVAEFRKRVMKRRS